MRSAVLIPARMGSSRLPGKPLADIGGRTLIARVIAIGLQCDLGPVIVAAAEPAVADAARQAGATAVITEPALRSGTDRIWQGLQRLGFQAAFDIVVNLQGDVPTIQPELVQKATRLLESAPQIDIATLVSPSEAQEDRDSPSVVKAALALRPGATEGRALYFSRAAVPFGAGPIWRHIGLYVYRRESLAAFVQAGCTPLEKRESLEQLRALEIGLRIDAAVVADFPKGIDTPEDLARARRQLAG